MRNTLHISNVSSRQDVVFIGGGGGGGGDAKKMKNMHSVYKLIANRWSQYFKA